MGARWSGDAAAPSTSNDESNDTAKYKEPISNTQTGTIQLLDNSLCEIKYFEVGCHVIGLEMSFNEAAVSFPQTLASC